MRWLILFLVSINATYTYSQDVKRSNEWMVGFVPLTKFNFNNNALRIDSFSDNIWAHFGQSNICDTNGVNLFTCNGFYVYAKDAYNGLPMKGIIYKWDTLNSALGHKFLTNQSGGNGYWNQQSLILPKSGNKYYVFTTGMSDAAFDRWKSPNATWDDFGMDVLTYHVVDMDKNNGKGGVISKNNVLIQHPYLSHNTMQAVRHANGKDWWLMKPGKERHTFYTFLVTPDTITGPFTQEFSYPRLTQAISGQSKFNQAGDKFVFCNENFEGDYHLYDFDRCTGLLNNYKHLFIPYDSSIHYDDWVGGVSFSENGRFLYVNSNYYLYQVDLENNYETIKVGEFTQAFPKWDASALAPDGKIYLGNENGVVKTMSYIDKPNEKGLACGFKPMALSQPYTNLKVPPNMPNYGLGALPNSACDTIRSLPQEWILYPNPSNGIIKIKSPIQAQRWQQYGTINVYNTQGQLARQLNPVLNTDYELVLDLSDLAGGLYTLEMHSDVLLGGVRKLWKVVLW
jgi:hypothetical protein